MSIRIRFPGGKRVDADLGDHVVRTDQSVEHGGAGSAPEPFDLFLASLATCAGLYVLGFCQARGIATEHIELILHDHYDAATHRLERAELEIVLPTTFPDKYRAAVERAAAACKVKKTLASPPAVVVATRIATPSAA